MLTKKTLFMTPAERQAAEERQELLNGLKFVWNVITTATWLDYLKFFGSMALFLAFLILGLAL